MNMDFHSYFKDDSARYELSKQYICANKMWLLSILAFTSRLIIDRWVNHPGHGRIKRYGINGSDKS